MPAWPPGGMPHAHGSVESAALACPAAGVLLGSSKQGGLHALPTGKAVWARGPAPSDVAKPLPRPVSNCPTVLAGPRQAASAD